MYHHSSVQGNNTFNRSTHSISSSNTNSTTTNTNNTNSTNSNNSNNVGIGIDSTNGWGVGVLPLQHNAPPHQCLLPWAVSMV